MRSTTDRKSKVERFGDLLGIIAFGLYFLRIVRSLWASGSDVHGASFIPSFFEQCLLMIAISIVLIHELTRFRVTGSRRPYLVRVCALTAASVFFVGANIAAALYLPRLLDSITLSHDSIARLESRLEITDRADPHYSEMSHILAEQKFLLDGRARTYVDPVGQNRIYTPSETTIEIRNGAVYVAKASSRLLWQAITLAIILCTALLAGSFTSPQSLTGAPNKAL